MTDLCQYLTSPSESWEGSSMSALDPVNPGRSDFGRMRRIKNPERFLCAWAVYAPEAVEKMVAVPPWLVRNAVAGHLVKPDTDCAACPHFKAGAPVE